MKSTDTLQGTSPSQYAALCASIGARNARKLCRSFGGSTLYIPKLDGIDRPRRNRQILQEAANGVSVAQLCISYGLSDRQIRRILRAAQEPVDFWSQPW